MIEDLGGTEGVDEAKGKIALIDADTIAYAAACGAEYADDKLAESFYTAEEWQAIVTDPQWDEDEHCVWTIDTEAAIAMATDRILGVIVSTKTISAELYFTEGRNFRYDVYDMYKANRKGSRTPAGLSAIKHALLEQYPGEICTKIEADDKVVMLKRTQPDRYVLCAVDKDVLNAIGGKHWNYYGSARYGIDPKWQTTTHKHAVQFPYIQCMAGDSGDNIPGCPRVGLKTGAKFIGDETDPAKMWEIVTKKFLEKKLTVKDAIRDMRLVNMNQLSIDGELVLWTPPFDADPAPQTREEVHEAFHPEDIEDGT